MKKPFNLDEWLKDKSQQVVTRSDRPVRIVCWDARTERPIIGIYPADPEEDGTQKDCVSFYKMNGRVAEGYVASKADLFIEVPDPELSEFEQQVFNLCNNIHSLDAITPDVVDVIGRRIKSLVAKNIVEKTI